MAACLMILLYVRYEMSYDKWIPDSERVYQIQSWYKSSETGEEAQLQMTPYASGAALAKDFPQVESQVYLFNNNPVFLKDGEATSSEDFLFTDGNFLAPVPLPLVRGDADALGQVNPAVLTETKDRIEIGTDEVIGQRLPTTNPRT